MVSQTDAHLGWWNQLSPTKQSQSQCLEKASDKDTGRGVPL